MIQVYNYEVMPVNFVMLGPEKQVDTITRFQQFANSLSHRVRIFITRSTREVTLGDSLYDMTYYRFFMQSYAEPIDNELQQFGITYQNVSEIPVPEVVHSTSGFAALPDGKISKSFTVYAIPGQLIEGFISETYGIANNVWIDINPISPDYAVTKMTRFMRMVKGIVIADVSKGKSPSQDKLIRQRMAEETLNNLLSGNMRLFEVSLTFTIIGKDLAEMRKNVKTFKSLIQGKLLKVDAPSFMQRLLIAGNGGKKLIMDTATVGTMFPFVSADMIELPGGILLGANRLTGAPVIFDPGLRSNYNISILGVSGGGKCVSSVTPILKADFNTVKPAFLWSHLIRKQNPVKLSEDEERIDAPGIALAQVDGERIGSCEVGFIYRQKYSGEMIKIRTVNGRSILCSPNHHLLTSGGWKAATDVVQSDKLIAPAPLNEIEGSVETNPELAELLGYIIGEAHTVHGDTATITNWNPDIQKRLEFLLNKYVWSWSKEEKGTYIVPKAAIEHIESYFRAGNDTSWSIWTYSVNKKLPSRLMSATLDAVKAFIGAFIAAEGGVSEKENRLAISTSSQSLADSMAFLFHRIGVLTYTRRKRVRLSYGDHRIYTSYETVAARGDNWKLKKLPFSAGKVDLLRNATRRTEPNTKCDIRDIRTVKYRGKYIYDFGMVGAPHYIAGHNGGIVVHNSYSGKIFLKRLADQNKKLAFFVVDPETEYITLGELLEAKIFDFDPGTELGLDPITLFPKLDAADIVAEITKIPAEYHATLRTVVNKSSTIFEVYDKSPPEVKRYLESVINGPEAFIFKGKPFDFSRRMVFSLRRLESDFLKQVISILIFGKIWRMANDENLLPRQDQKMIIVDEAWLYAQIPAAAKFLERVSRLGRKRNIIFLNLTQRPADVLGETKDKPGPLRTVIENSATKFVLRQDESSVQAVVDALGMSPNEKEQMTEFKPGNGILVTDSGHIPIQFVASEEEHTIFSTKPSEFEE